MPDLLLRDSSISQYLRKRTFDEEMPTKVVVKGTFNTTTHKEIVTKTEYYWEFTAQHQLIAFEGNNPEKCVVLQESHSTIMMISAIEQTPRPETAMPTPIDASIGWLLQHLEPQQRVGTFKIDRSSPIKCRTPRRNAQVDEAVVALSSLVEWGSQIESYITNLSLQHTFLAQTRSHEAAIFVPVIPLMRNNNSAAPSKDLVAGTQIRMHYVLEMCVTIGKNSFQEETMARTSFRSICWGPCSVSTSEACRRRLLLSPRQQTMRRMRRGS